MDSISPFQITIPRYKEVPDGKKNATFYVIETTKKDSEPWVVEKRYKEFDELLSALKKTHANLPNLPGKTLFSLKDSSEIEKRRADLEKFLQSIVCRTDLISSDPVKRFLQIENFAPEHTVTPPKLISDVQGLVLGVRDFLYEAKEGLLFTAISDMSVTSRVDSYLTNMKMPWEKELPPGTLVTVGAVECYMNTGKDEYKFDKLWTKTFQTQVIHLLWDSASNLLITGKDDGSITVLKVSAELNYIKYDEVVSNKLHLSRVMGLFFDPISELIYTVSEDKKFKVYDMNKNDVVSDMAVGTSPLTCLVGDRDNKRVFMSNKAGQVFIYDISSKTPKHVHTIQAHTKGNIRGLNFDTYKNYLFTANIDDGVMGIFDLHKPGKERHANHIANFQGKKGVRFICWSTGRYELYSGDEDGNVTFWDAKKCSPLYALKAHNDGITKLQWMENCNTLITAGKDKKIRFYQLPDEWRDKRLEAELLKDSKIQKQNEGIQRFKEQQQKKAEDSDEDDLAGWHK